ncbi:hypothetical protein DDW13_06655 [Acidianus hospitalis]|uniref:Uncharacterized protein n=1 Tax=Acidianus hospitalis TaxID=563177 RepID=A0A2T9X3H3_9CREN|nr:hypothetical protein DDW13_06655 [Acidianus hospitalis]
MLVGGFLRGLILGLVVVLLVVVLSQGLILPYFLTILNKVNMVKKYNSMHIRKYLLVNFLKHAYFMDEKIKIEKDQFYLID